MNEVKQKVFLTPLGTFVYGCWYPWNSKIDHYLRKQDVHIELMVKYWNKDSDTFKVTRFSDCFFSDSVSGEWKSLNSDYTPSRHGKIVAFSILIDRLLSLENFEKEFLCTSPQPK